MATTVWSDIASTYCRCAAPSIRKQRSRRCSISCAAICSTRSIIDNTRWAACSHDWPCRATPADCRWSACYSIWTRRWTSGQYLSPACVLNFPATHAHSRISSCSSTRCKSTAACAWSANTTATCSVAKRSAAGSTHTKRCFAMRSRQPRHRGAGTRPSVGDDTA
jgi:hypothetical protein